MEESRGEVCTDARVDGMREGEGLWAEVVEGADLPREDGRGEEEQRRRQPHPVHAEPVAPVVAVDHHLVPRVRVVAAKEVELARQAGPPRLWRVVGHRRRR